MSYTTVSSTASHSLDQTGSLLRMFRSEGFDAHMHVAYLFRMRENQGVQDYLTNELYRMGERDVDFYLPELCLMALARSEAEKLHAFLLDRAALRMYYAVKIHWMFQSAVEDVRHPPKSAALLENAMRLYQESEMAVVNARCGAREEKEGTLSPSSASPGPSLEDMSNLRALSRKVVVCSDAMIDHRLRLYKQLGDAIPSSTRHWVRGALAATHRSSADLDLFMLKQLRCDYFNQLNSFVSQLTDLSSWLVANCASSHERKKSLFLAICQINHWLMDRRVAAALSGGAGYMTGVWLPVASVASETTHIVKIHHSESKVFRTKQRALFLITCEVVDLADCEGTKLAELVLEELSACVVEQKREDDRSVDGTIDGRIIDGRLSPRGDQAPEDRSVHEPATELSPTHQSAPPVHQSVPQSATTSKLSQFLFSPSFNVNLFSQLLYPSDLFEASAGTVTGDSTPPQLFSARLATAAELTAPVVIVPDSAVTVVSVAPTQPIGGQSTGGQPTGGQPTGGPGSSSPQNGQRPTFLRSTVFGHEVEDRAESIRANSVYGKLASWRLQRVLVKGGDDVRQEVLAVQLVSLMKNIFDSAKLPLWLRPYEVVVTSANSGLIEMIPNTVSVDALKKEFNGTSLKEIFPNLFSDKLNEAQTNFIQSTAAYSVVSYLLQIRDRHNGNLLLDSKGHLMHIDFGFMLSNAPGGSFALETSPFKLTQEYIDVMGGEYSTQFETFRSLVIRAFLEARKHRDHFCQLVKIVGECNLHLPCFSTIGVDACVQALSDRFLIGITEETCIERIVGLIDESINNWRTIQYDNYQRITNGIL